MKNFNAYLKLNLQMISGDLVLTGMVGLFYLLMNMSFLGIIFSPWIILGIAWLGSRPLKKLFDDSLFGPAASLHLSLPLDCRTVILVKVIAAQLANVVMLASIILPLLIAKVNFWSLGLNLIGQGKEMYYSRELILAVVVADLVLIFFMGIPIDLWESIRYHSRPLDQQNRGRRFLSRLPILLPAWAVIFWNLFREDGETPILDWLASKQALPVLLAVGAVEILVGVLAVRGSIRLLETRYQR